MPPPRPPASSPNFQSIFNNALQTYENRTKLNLLADPLAAQLQFCDSPGAIIAVLRQQVHIEDLEIVNKLIGWLDPIVNVLHTLSVSVGGGISLLISPAKVIFTGVGLLLSAPTGIGESLDLFLKLFERIGQFFERLRAKLGTSLTAEMVDIAFRIMVEILSVLAIATMEVKQGSTRKIMKKFLGRNDMEDGLRRLDILTQEEARMASAQRLQGVMLDLNDNVVSVISGEIRVRSRQTTIDDKLARSTIDGSDQRLAVQQIASDESQIKLIQLRNDLRHWLSSPDPSTNHCMARNARHKGTSEWFLEGDTFKQWKSSKPKDSLLWVHGKPGSGKSVLCSAIIEDIKPMCNAGLASIAYFYFDFRDINKQRRRNLISSCLSQLSAQSNRYLDILHRLYLAHYSGSQVPSDGVLTECLKDMLLIRNEVPVYIIMDAIDECPNSSGLPSPREQVLGLVEELVRLRLPNLRLCVTSRPEIDIRVVLEPLSSFWVSLLEKTGQNKDIIDYIRNFVRSDRNMRRWREEDRELVIQVLAERADGSFRWVFSQLEMLRRCLPARVRRALDEMPETLDETYERILMEIDLANRNHARRLFQCLTVASRPLRVEELAEVLAVDFDTEGAPPKLNVNWRWEDPVQAVLSTCSSLVSIVNSAGSSVVLFSHFSVKEYLTSSRLERSSGRVSFYHISPEPAHTTLAQACLSVLLRLDDHFDLNIENFPLAAYAAEHWVEHARSTSDVREAMELLFDPEKPHFANWVSIYDMDESPPTPHPTQPNAAPLYYAALCGFDSVVKWLIGTRHVDVDARGGHHERAIQAALYKGHISIVKLLIEHGADINIRDGKGSSLLHVAAQNGNHEAVLLLLSCGADVQATDSNHWPVLFAALSNGDPTVVRLLIEHGADTDVRDGDLLTALHIASGNKSSDVVALLIERGADVSARDSKDSTPLHIASAEGNDIIARLLMDHGADPNALDNTNSTSLHLASAHGHSDVVALLIERGADVSARDGKDSTPLHIASAEGSDVITRLLMDRGADPNALDNTNSSPLHLASVHGHSDVVALLIERGANVGARDGKNSTPLHLASTKGNMTVVGMLIDHGADVNTPGEKGNTPLHVASRSNVVKLLLERGARPNPQNDEGRTPLSIASQEGAVDVVQCLLTAGANVNLRDRNDRTPRDVAPNNSEVKQLLTQRAAPVQRRLSLRILSQLQRTKSRASSPHPGPPASQSFIPPGPPTASPKPFTPPSLPTASPKPFMSPSLPTASPKPFIPPSLATASPEPFIPPSLP